MTARFLHLRADVGALPLADNSADALLCDPPYGLNFMSKKWDAEVPGVEVWQEVYRVLKPGAFGLVFGGTRTFPFLALALVGAGLALRNTLCWLYGEGFPKSLDISKAIDCEAGAEREVIGRHPNPAGSPGNTFPLGQECEITAPATEEAKIWDGYGIALKPAWEPVLLIRKPPEGTNAANCVKWGTRALNIDGGRIGTERMGGYPAVSYGFPRILDGNSRRAYTPREAIGRWPANVVFDEVAAGMLDEQSGASRFFYQAKANPGERNAGLAGLEKRPAGAYGDFAGDGRGRQTEHRPARNHHTTVKPIDLCRWLATLLLPPDTGRPRTLLVPFAGSGSEMIGGGLAGWDHIVGAELNREYIEIQRLRCAWWAEHGALGVDTAVILAEGEVRDAEKAAGQTQLEVG